MAFLLPAIIFGALSSMLARRKGYSPGWWAVLGALFWLVPPVILLMLDDKEIDTGGAVTILTPTNGPRTLCPQCGEFIPSKATVCGFCQYDLVGKPAPKFIPAIVAPRVEAEPERAPVKTKSAPAIPLPAKSVAAEHELLLRAANTRSRLAFLVVIPLFLLGLAICGVFALKLQKPTTLPPASSENRPVADSQKPTTPPESASSRKSESDSEASADSSSPPRPKTEPAAVVEEAPAPRPEPTPAAQPPVAVVRPPSVTERPPTLPDDEPAPQVAETEEKPSRVDAAKAELEDVNDQLTIVGKVLEKSEKKLRSANAELEKAKAALEEAKAEIANEQANINDANASVKAARTNLDAAQANRRLKDANWRLNMAQGHAASAEKTIATKQAAYNESEQATKLVRKQYEEVERAAKAKAASVEQLSADAEKRAP